MLKLSAKVQHLFDIRKKKIAFYQFILSITDYQIAMK